MKISMIDAGKYFKGLLLLIRKDHKVTETEIALIARVGKQLGFEKEFCDTAVQEILKNRYIEDSPPEFSSKELAMMFIRDGLVVALSDKHFDHKEEKWLKSVADKNGIDTSWLRKEIKNTLDREDIGTHLEADDLTVE